MNRWKDPWKDVHSRGQPWIRPWSSCVEIILLLQSKLGQQTFKAVLSSGAVPLLNSNDKAFFISIHIFISLYSFLYLYVFISLFISFPLFLYLIWQQDLPCKANVQLHLSNHGSGNCWNIFKWELFISHWTITSNQELTNRLTDIVGAQIGKVVVSVVLIVYVTMYCLIYLSILSSSCGRAKQASTAICSRLKKEK